MLPEAESRERFMSTQTTIGSFGPVSNLEEGQSGDSRLSDFLRHLARLLDESGTRYCVLHSWQDLPEGLSSDLDIAVHPDDRNRLAVAIRCLGKFGFSPIQLINHNVNGNYFVFCWHSGGKLHTAAVDVIFEHRRGGLIADGGAELTAARERYGDFRVASPSAELSYLLLKQAVKGKVKPKQAVRIRELVVLLGRERAEQIARKSFSVTQSRMIISACLDGTLPEILLQMRRASWVMGVTRKPINLLRYLAGDTKRLVRRWKRPNGIFVAILGPDGVGKSSAIGGLHGQIGGAFWGERYFHLRPQFFVPRKPAPPVTDPHAKPPRGKLASSLRLTALLADYCLGYAFQLRQLKPRSHLLVFDRYFFDVLVDPKRFRFGGPMWLARLYARLVPSPDLVLVLDVDVEIMLARKSELDRAELIRQREAYRRLSVKGSRVSVINTSGTPEEVAYQVAAKIAEFMSQRFMAMHPEWMAANP